MAPTLLQQYIARQPALWRRLLDGREALTGPFAARFGGDFDRVVLLGSGSSHYAAQMARPVLERALGAEVTCLVPSDFGAPPSARRVLYIAVSQSGESTNIYELIRRLTDAGQVVAAVTERADSPVGQAASLAVPLPMEPEAIGAKTLGVTATVLTLMLLGLSVCRDGAWRGELLDAMEDLCNNGEEILRRAQAWSLAHRAALLPYSHLEVLGCGSGLGAAREGALKLLETNYLPVCAYALDEYLHGIQNALDGGTCLLCLLPREGPGRTRMLRLADFARGVGARCCLIAPGGAEDPDALVLPDAGHPALEPLVFLPAVQTLAACLSAARGIDTSRRRYPAFFSLMGSKLEEPPCRAGR